MIRKITRILILLPIKLTSRQVTIADFVHGGCVVESAVHHRIADEFGVATKHYRHLNIVYSVYLNKKIHFKMKYIAYIIMTIIFFSCEKKKESVIPAEVEEYVSSFFNDARDNGLNIYLSDYDLTIAFSELEDAAGTCNSSNNTIYIDSSEWYERMTETNRKWLIYHELGHCILEREHAVGAFENGECKSIMNSHISNSECFTNFVSDSWQEYYVGELFTEENQLPAWYILNITPKVADASVYNYIDIDTVLVENQLTLTEVPFNEGAIQICVDAFNWKSRGSCLRTEWSNLKYDVCPGYNNTYIKGDTQDSSFPEYYYRRERTDITLQDSITICLQRNSGFYHFFINEQIIHTMSSEPVSNQNLYIYTGSLLDTAPTSIQLTYFNF